MAGEKGETGGESRNQREINRPFLGRPQPSAGDGMVGHGTPHTANWERGARRRETGAVYGSNWTIRQGITPEIWEASQGAKKRNMLEIDLWRSKGGAGVRARPISIKGTEGPGSERVNKHWGDRQKNSSDDSISHLLQQIRILFSGDRTASSGKKQRRNLAYHQGVGELDKNW